MIRELNGKKGGRMGFLSQSCEADIKLTSTGKGMEVTLNNYIGRVNIISVLSDWPIQGDPASNELAEKSYPSVDLTAIKLAIEMGGRYWPVVMKVETRDGKKMTCKLTGASKDKKTGKETFSVKPFSGLLPFGAFIGVRIEFLGRSIAEPALGIGLPALPGVLDLPVAPASWDAANQKLIVLPHDNDRDCYLFVQVLNSAIFNKRPVVVVAIRAGSTKKEKKMVRYVSSYKVDGNKIEVVLWNKGLKSKGEFAGNAVDGFSSGKYTIQSIRLLPTHDTVCLFNDDCFDDGFDYSYQPISVAAGLLEKTGGAYVGEFELNFKVDRAERLLSFDKKKKEVSSASVSRYLRDLERYLRRASNEVVGSANFVGFGLSDGKTVVGEIKSLRNNNGRYMAAIYFAYSDAEELKNTTSVGTFIFGDGLWRGVVSR